MPPFSIPPPEHVPSSLSFSLLLGAQILANVFLYLCAITVGIMSYYMADRKHRKAFLEARQSLEVKMNLEEQSQQQVRLFQGGPRAVWARGREPWLERGWGCGGQCGSPPGFGVHCQGQVLAACWASRPQRAPPDFREFLSPETPSSLFLCA